MHKFLGFVIVSIALFVVGCGPKIIYETKQDVKEPWPYEEAHHFEFEIKDTVPAYDLHMKVDHSPDFGYENLYVMIKTTFPDGNVVNHPLSLQLADGSGQWVGDCSSHVCNSDILIASDSYYKIAGKYKISIQQHSRVDTLSGVKAIGIKVNQSAK
jgi:gliding motility-associated lipoprotein GldH